MPARVTCEPIDWEGLVEGFASFELDPQLSPYDASLFEQSLVDPPPGFLEPLLASKFQHRITRAEALKLLYFFLLKKRYEERLNLLHFTFHIFDEDSLLPQEIIDQTPFPHEDGIPKFKHFNDPDFRWGLK